MSFFARFVVRDLCIGGCRQNFANFFLPLTPSLPPSLFFFQPVKISVSPCSLPLGCFARRKVCDSATEIPY